MRRRIGRGRDEGAGTFLGADGRECGATSPSGAPTERELYKSVSLLRAALESTADGLLVVDSSGRIAGYNQRFLEMWRIPPEVIASGEDRKALLFVLEQLVDPASFQARVAELYASPEEESFDVLEFKDGRTYERFSRPQCLDNGQVVGRVWSFRDVTDRVTAERKLAVREERYRTFFEQCLTGNFISRPDGTLLACNQRLAELLGYESPEELKSVNMVTLYPRPEERQELVERIRRDGVIDLHERSLRRRDGSQVRILAWARGIRDEEGNCTEIQGSIVDVTARQRLEEQLLQAQKMEAMGRLAGSVAHDFNNVLTAILGYCNLALPRLEGDETVRASLVEIERAAQRAASLTRQLLAFGRRQALDPAVVALSDIVAGLESMLERLGPEDVELEVRLHPDAGYIRADRGQIEQVILNLVVNAFDAMPDGGRLRLETFSSGGFPAWAVLRVEDTGTGMEAAVQRRVFEPFFTTKPEGKGTGLGLSTVYGIVQQSGGRIELESAPGEGTRFDILLPQVPAPQPSAYEGGPARRGTTILLVEDDPAVQGFARRCLESGGYEVLAASSGVEALSVLEANRDEIELVLTDVVMPKMGGVELAQRLMASGCRAKVVFMSGYAAEAVGGPGIPSDVPLLQKPFTPSGLLRCVGERLEAPA